MQSGVREYSMERYHNRRRSLPIGIDNENYRFLVSVFYRQKADERNQRASWRKQIMK